MTTRTDQDAAPVTQGVYVYGIVRAGAPVSAALPTVGGSGALLQVTCGSLAALVSEVELDRPLGTREDLLAHEEVLDTVAAESTVLPLRFGGVVTDVDAVHDELLTEHHDHFAAVLHELDGLVQFSLRGRYADQVHLREIVAEVPEIGRLRDSLREAAEDEGYAERVRLGELVSEAVERTRARDVEVALAALDPLCAATAVRKVSGQDDALSVALLVDRDRIAAFEDGVDDLGQRWADRVRLRLLGPMAPYDFLPES